MYTFKAQAKSNAKRFLVATCKIENFDDYLTQNGEGNWGTYMLDGKPVPHATVRGAMEGKIAALAAEVNSAIPPAAAAPAPAAVEQAPAEEVEEAAAPSPSASAFGAFALSQLAADPAPAVTSPAPAAARPAREGATPTSGLKIQKDRPVQNGVSRQSAGSVGDKLWSLYDAAGPEVTLEQAKNLAVQAGLSPTSAAIALYNWRKFHGIASRPITKA